MKSTLRRLDAAGTQLQTQQSSRQKLTNALTVLPFSLTDRIFYMDYYTHPVFGLITAALCLAVSLIIGAVRKYRAK